MEPRNKFIIPLIIIIVSLVLQSCSSNPVSAPSAFPGELTGKLDLHFINVDQGDSTLVVLSSGEIVLIDAGSPAAGPGLVRYLKARGITHIDHFIFTHPHDDHIGGIFSLASEFEITHFYDNGFSNFRSTLYGDYLKIVRKDLSAYSILQAGETLRLGALKIEVVNPLLPPTGNLNDDSIALRLHFGEVIFLLAGDMGAVAEQRLLNTGASLSSQILKVGHHGENDGSSNEFLKHVNPETAIIGVSIDNTYGRPHKELLARLKSLEARIFRTDRDGHIVLETDGSSYSIRTEKTLNPDNAFSRLITPNGR